MYGHPATQRPDAIHFFVNFDVFISLSRLKLAWLTPNLGILWISVCSFWLYGSIVANPIIYRLLPSPSRFETRQCGSIVANPIIYNLYLVLHGLKTSNDTQIRVTGSMEPEKWWKMLRNLNEKPWAKFPATTRGYSMAKIACLYDAFLKVFE